MDAGRRPRVVVADDHPGVRNAVTSILARACEVVASAADGAAAVDAVLRLRPDVVVLDVAMPGVDGFQAASRIRASGSNAPIVFLSNHADDDFVLAGVSRGASAFVAKQRMERDLVAAVAHAQAGRRFVPSARVLPRWPRPAGRRHDLQLYATDALLVEAVTAFFESALEAGDSIVAVVTEPHRQALDARFTARGLEVAALVAAGRYSRLDAASALAAILRDGRPDAAQFAAQLDPLVERALAAATASPGHVALFGEVAPLLYARNELSAALELERIADEFSSSRRLSILCGYLTAALPSEADDPLASICAEHSTIVPA